MALSLAQRRRFAREGFLVVRGVVDAKQVRAALRAINHWLDKGYESAERDSYRSRSFAPELCGDPVILELLTASGAFGLVSELVGVPLEVPDSAQIALHFPSGADQIPGGPWPHLDGVPTPMNGVPLDGRLHGHTVLAGVLLSNIPRADEGNFTVWPGTHLTMASWFEEHGTAVSEPGLFLEEVARLARSACAPRAVTGRAGDLVLAHYLLLHSAGVHTGPNIRYAVFFRLHSERRAEMGDVPYTDPWAEWEALADVVPAPLSAGRRRGGHARPRA